MSSTHAATNTAPWDGVAFACNILLAPRPTHRKLQPTAPCLLRKTSANSRSTQTRTGGLRPPCVWALACRAPQSACWQPAMRRSALWLRHAPGRTPGAPTHHRPVRVAWHGLSRSRRLSPRLAFASPGGPQYAPLTARSRHLGATPSFAHAPLTGQRPNSAPLFIHSECLPKRRGRGRAEQTTASLGPHSTL
jgi:hypothetical protein